MSDVAIHVENLGKRYRIGALQQSGSGYRYKALRDVLAGAASSVGRCLTASFPGRQRVPAEETEIWALKNVSLEIKAGEVVGVIGRNGAGKSTLLKILSRITEPTEGYVRLQGRIGSLLEVGTGFHPELTGRENIYLNGAILGMKKAEIKRRFDEIVAFAEVEKFIDTPVKHYSSGMYLRLAFAVAAHLEPEILLVDEVLAVGDAQFQKKCLGKMGDVATQGRTVLFVSHNMAAIRVLCNTALLLDSGQVACNGPVLKCVEEYLSISSGHSGSILDHVQCKDSALEIESITINGSTRDELELAANVRLLRIEASGWLSRPLRLELEARLCDCFETPLAFFSPGHERGFADLYPAGHFRLIRTLELPRVMRGQYVLSLYLTDPNIVGWVDIPGALMIVAEGTPMATGYVFDMHDRGWILLSDGSR